MSFKSLLDFIFEAVPFFVLIEGGRRRPTVFFYATSEFSVSNCSSFNYLDFIHSCNI